MLEVEVLVYNKLVMGCVKDMPEFFRGTGLIADIGDFRIHSVGSPALDIGDLYLRGNHRGHDYNTFICDCGSPKGATAVANKINKAIKYINSPEFEPVRDMARPRRGSTLIANLNRRPVTLDDYRF